MDECSSIELFMALEAPCKSPLANMNQPYSEHVKCANKTEEVNFSSSFK